MKITKETKFAFSEEEIDAARGIRHLILDLSDEDWEELQDQAGLDEEFFNQLDLLCGFMQENVDLQDGN